MDKKPNEIHKHLISTKINYHILLANVVVMDLQMWKIGCVNYAHFPKSGHQYKLLYIQQQTQYNWPDFLAAYCLLNSG